MNERELESAARQEAFERGRRGEEHAPLGYQADFDRGRQEWVNEKAFNRKMGEGIGTIAGILGIIGLVAYGVQLVVDATVLGWQTIATFPGLLLTLRLGEIWGRLTDLPTLSLVMLAITVPLAVMIILIVVGLVMEMFEWMAPAISKGKHRGISYEIRRHPSREERKDRYEVVLLDGPGAKMAFSAAFPLRWHAYLSLEVLTRAVEGLPPDPPAFAFAKSDGTDLIAYCRRYRQEAGVADDTDFERAIAALKARVRWWWGIAPKLARTAG